MEYEENLQITQNDTTNMFSSVACIFSWKEKCLDVPRTKIRASNLKASKTTELSRLQNVRCVHRQCTVYTVYTKLIYYATLMTVVHRVLSSIYDVSLANSTLHSYSSLEKRTLKPIIIILNSCSLFPNCSLA